VGTGAGILKPPASAPQQRGDDGDERRDLQADQPHEVSADLLVNSLLEPFETLFEFVDAKIRTVKPLIEIDHRLANPIDHARMLPTLTFEKRHALFPESASSGSSTIPSSTFNRQVDFRKRTSRAGKRASNVEEGEGRSRILQATPYGHVAEGAMPACARQGFDAPPIATSSG
jgi:hypothetical protein